MLRNEPASFLAPLMRRHDELDRSKGPIANVAEFIYGVALVGSDPVFLVPAMPHFKGSLTRSGGAVSYETGSSGHPWGLSRGIRT